MNPAKSPLIHCATVFRSGIVSGLDPKNVPSDPTRRIDSIAARVLTLAARVYDLCRGFPARSIRPSANMLLVTCLRLASARQTSWEIMRRVLRRGRAA
jgi:hypothetical protein